MKRSLFFIIAALLGTIFGAMMFFLPDKALNGFKIDINPEAIMLIRTIGALVLSAAILNFLVRNHGDSITLKTVLWYNIILHLFSFAADMWGYSDGVLTISAIAPALVVHAFVIAGSLYYAMKMKVAAA